MPGTSSAEGGQQGPDAPKATSGVKNGFVRPVAVANIFRPVVTEDKPVLPERRRFSTFSDLKSTDTIKLSSTETSSRRQSCDIKSSAPFGQSLLRKTPKHPAPSVRTSASTSSTDAGSEDIKVKNEETKPKQAAEDVSVKPTDNSSVLSTGVANGSCPLPDDKGSRTVSAQNEANDLRKRGNRVRDSGSLKEKKTEEKDKYTREINKDSVVSNQLPQANSDRKGDASVSSLLTSDKTVTLKTVASEQVKDSCGQKNDQSVSEKSKSNIEVSDKVTGQIIPKTLSNSIIDGITNKPSEPESQPDHKDIQIPSNVRTVRRTSDVIAAKIQNIFCNQSEKQSTSSGVNRLRRGKNVLSRFEEKIQITPNEGKETSTAAVQNVSEVSKTTEAVDTIIAISDVKTSVVFESSVNKEVSEKKPSQPGAAEKKSVSAESQQFTHVSNIVFTETSTQAKPVGKKQWTIKTTEQSKTEGIDVSIKKPISDNKVLIETDITESSDKNQTASKGFVKGLPPTLKQESKSKPNATDVKNQAQSENNSPVIALTGIIQFGSENKKRLLTDKQVTTSGVTASSEGVSKQQPHEGKQKQIVEKPQHGTDSAPSDKQNSVRQLDSSNKNIASTSQDTKRVSQLGPSRSSNIADKGKTTEVKQHSNSSISEATAATKTASKNQKAVKETSAEKNNSSTPEQISLSGGKTSSNQAESSKQQTNLDKKQNDDVKLTAQRLLTNSANTSHDSVRKTITSDKYDQLTSKQTTSVTSSVSAKESTKHLKTESKCKGTSPLSEKKTLSVPLNSSKKQINTQNQEENKKEPDLIKDEKPVLNGSQSSKISVQKDAVITETLKVDKVTAERKGSAEVKKIGIEKNTSDTLATKGTVLLSGKEKSGIIVKSKENLTQQKCSDSKSLAASTSSKLLVTVSSDSNASSGDPVKHTERKIDSSAATDKPKHTSEPVSYLENKPSTLFLKGNSKEDQSKGHPVSQIQKTSSSNADVLVQDTTQDKQSKNASADSLSTKSQSPLKGKIEKEVTKSVDEIKTKVYQTASNEKEPIDQSSGNSKVNVLTSNKTNNVKIRNSSASTSSNILDSTDNVENKVDSHCQLEVSDSSQTKPSVENFPTSKIQSSSADFIGTESKQQTSDDLNLSQEQPAARKNSFEHKIYDLQKQELVTINLNTAAEEGNMSIPRGISSKNSDRQVIDIKDLQRTLKCESPGSKLATDILLSSTESTKDIPRPPDRKRSSVSHRDSSLPPPLPLRTISRVGSLKRSDDSRFSIDRSLDILRSSSQSSMSPVHSYSPQKFSYTEMMAKLCSYGVNPSLSGSNRRFGASQVSELWADLSEEQSSGTHTSEMLEAETTERMRLEKEVQDLHSRFSHVQQKSEKMEMEMLEARVYRTAEVNGDLSEDEENEATSSIYKQKYERAVRDMEVMKRRLQQQHEEELEQKLMIKKATDKRLAEALEDIEEEKQVVIQWKRKAQKLGSELQDLRLMLEEQMARNGELEKRQRRFDAELSAAQEEIRKERLIREKLQRERDQAQHEKYSLEQELHSTRLDMDMQHEKITQLNRELDELALSSKGEEEVTQLKRAKQELERRARDQEEELEELAGQVQLLEQSKLRLEMSLEKQRQEHRRETSVREEEIEEIRAGSSKKIKNLEAQLETEQEDRHQLVKQKHELERRIIELNDQPPPHDPEIEHRLRRDLKRTKALLRDAQTMLEHMRDGQANKTLIRQLKNQLEDAEFAKTAALKARQGAELELQDLQSQMEELARTKNDAESRCLQLSREKSAYQAQLEEMEEEMAEVMKKYKATVAQMSIDQKSMADQNQQISELESEKHNLKEQLTEMSNKLDHLAGQTEDTHRVHRLDAKVRDLESKLELEQTTRSRLEHQIMRLKEQCDKMREECDSLRNKELQAQEGVRRLQRQLRELREDYTALQQKESETYHKQHELEMALENNEADLQVTKNDLRLACQRIQDLQNALEEDLDSGTDVPDDSGSESDSSLDMSSVLRRQCLTPLQRHDSISSDLSLEFDGRRSRTSSFSQDMSILGSRNDVEKDINGFSRVGGSRCHAVSIPDNDQLELV